MRFGRIRAVTWCGGSAGGVDHMLVGLIAEACGIPMANVRYIAHAGGGAASAALLGGQVTAGVTGYSEWRGLARKAACEFSPRHHPSDLAIGRSRRSGRQDSTCCSINGVRVLPPGLKAEHLAWWQSVIERMHASDVWRQHMSRSGWEDGYLARDDFRRLVHADQDRYTQTLARLHIVRAAVAPRQSGRTRCRSHRRDRHRSARCDRRRTSARPG